MRAGPDGMDEDCGGRRRPLRITRCRLENATVTMTKAMVPVFVTVPVGCNTMQVAHDISSVTAPERLWCASGSTSVTGGDGRSHDARTSYYQCMGGNAAEQFKKMIMERFPAVTVVVGEERRRFRDGLTYRLHTYSHDTGPGHRDFIYIKGRTRRSAPAFRPVGEPSTASAIDCTALSVDAPGLVGEAAAMPDGSVIFAAHVIEYGMDSAAT